MTAADDEEPFLSRWSRRKLEAKEHAAEELPVAEAPGAASAASSAAAVQSAATESPPAISPEYREFFDPRVDEKLRRAALKKLFSDPQFNVMDGLDTYIDDYSKPDLIPEAMLRQLNQAKELFLFDDEESAGESARDEVSAAAAAAALPPEAADASLVAPAAAAGPRPEGEAAASAGAAGSHAAESRND